MNWVDYRERLGVGFGDNDKLQMCINRTKNYVKDLVPFYTEENLFIFANTLGIDYSSYNRKRAPLEFALIHVCDSWTLKDFISKYVALTNSAGRTIIIDKDNKALSELFELIIVKTLEDFRIPYEIIRDNDGVFIFPKGISEFDKTLISDSFIWLSQYPETEKAWGKALRAYSSGEGPSEVADQFRKALERFFQNYFNSEKNLENLIPEYGLLLKNHGIIGNIAADLECLIRQYKNFMNDHAKHHDRTNKLLLEYIMYQTGNTMRLMIKLAEEKV